MTKDTTERIGWKALRARARRSGARVRVHDGLETRVVKVVAVSDGWLPGTFVMHTDDGDYQAEKTATVAVIRRRKPGEE